MDGCMPLRYKISSWDQLPQCRSNNSRDLKISVTNFVQNHILYGYRILLEHETYGVLFACVIDAKGSLVSDFDDGLKQELTSEQILAELAKYGYCITYQPNENLTGDQIQYLITLKNLHYDKIRVLNVWDTKNDESEFRPKVIVFNAESNPKWLQASYSPQRKEYESALDNGSAINISAISNSRNYRWDWLVNSVENIDDIIADNAQMCTNYDGSDDPHSI